MDAQKDGGDYVRLRKEVITVGATQMAIPWLLGAAVLPALGAAISVALAVVESWRVVSGDLDLWQASPPGPAGMPGSRPES